MDTDMRTEQLVNNTIDLPPSTSASRNVDLDSIVTNQGSEMLLHISRGHLNNDVDYSNCDNESNSDELM